MNLYSHDLSFLDFNFNDPTIDTLASDSSTSHSNSFTTVDEHPVFNHSPPRHRHDGTSPLPLGMDWSPPPRKWDGRDSIWPHDPHTGWSYCVTVPSWNVLAKSSGSDPVVFYRVHVSIQSPEGITTTRGILRRFSDFLKLFSDLKKAFPKKNLPSAPPKRLLKIKSRTLLEERRCSLEDWMEKLLSDLDVSRSVAVATFLELEAVVRSSFYDENQQVSDANSSATGIAQSSQFQLNSDVSVLAGSSSVASDYATDSAYEISELGTPKHGRDNYLGQTLENLTFDKDFTDPIETTVKHGMFTKDFIPDNIERFSRRKMHGERENSDIGRDRVSEHTSKATFRGDRMEFVSELDSCKSAGHIRRQSTESIGSELSSVRTSDILNLGLANPNGDDSFELPEGAEAATTVDMLVNSDLQLQRGLLVALPSDEKHKFNRVLITMQRRLGTAKTDMEDLIARLNQELAVRQYLTTKVKDLEVELETTKENCKENIQQASLIERERITQMQWDMEELQRKCLETELKLKSEQDEKVHTELTKASIIKENNMLLRELDFSREQLENLQKHNEELELKSKADVKLLVKEVKSLRSSQSEMKQELSRLMKEKLEVERILQKQKQRRDHANTANTKLLHECEILQNRLQECSVNFLIEEEDKIKMDTSSPSDAIDLLITSDNRIGLLLAEAQLLAQDVENAVAAMGRRQGNNDDDEEMRMRDDELRKMLTDTFVDNARLRMQVNSVIRCALNTPAKSEEEEEQEETPSSRKTVLSKFLDR